MRMLKALKIIAKDVICKPASRFEDWRFSVRGARADTKHRSFRPGLTSFRAACGIARSSFLAGPGLANRRSGGAVRIRCGSPPQ